MYDATTGDETNNAICTMTSAKGEWTMVNTMTGPATGGTLSHWAGTVQSQKGDRTWDRLPFARR